MGSNNSIIKVNFEDVQYALQNKGSHIFINTLPSDKQDCIIPFTIPAHEEELLINDLITKGKYDFRIIIYGENANDDSVLVKYKQLVSLGFRSVFIYGGGLFEWFQLGEIYGSDEFPRTKAKVDLLRFKAKKKLNVMLLEY
jgi:hypothetical protein